MASPSGYQFALVGEPDVYFAFATVTTDGYGAVASVTHSDAILTVTEDGSTAGLFHVLLKEDWPVCLYVGQTVDAASAKAGTLKLASESVSTGALTLQFEQSGSAAHLTNGGFKLMLVLQNVSL